MINTKLQKIISHAYNTVPYYKETFNDVKNNLNSINSLEELQILPTLTKSKVLEMLPEFISDEYMYFPKNEELEIHRTSGSTGKCLKVYWSKKDVYQAMLALWKERTLTYGIKPLSRMCTMNSYMYRNNRLEVYNEGINIFMEYILSFNNFHLDNDKLEIFYREIMKFDVQWMLLQPSVAHLLAIYISENRLKVPSSLKYIELVGEMLFDFQREKIIETYNVPVVNMYGSSESLGIAQECPDGNMHILDDNIVVELLKNGLPVDYGEEGEVYITTLSNTAMPLIRYALGDRAILYPASECKCGRKGNIIRILAGRNNDCFITKDKKHYSAGILVYLIETVNKLMKGPIRQFKAIQNDYENITLKLVLINQCKGWKGSIVELFLKETEKLDLNCFKWDLQFVDNIFPDSKTGKLNFVSNNIRTKETHNENR